MILASTVKYAAISSASYRVTYSITLWKECLHLCCTSKFDSLSVPPSSSFHKLFLFRTLNDNNRQCFPKLNDKKPSLSPSVIKPHIFFPNHPICRPILPSSSHPLSSQSPSSFQRPTLRHPSRHQSSRIPHSTYRADILVPSLRSSSFDSSSPQILSTPSSSPKFNYSNAQKSGMTESGVEVLAWWGGWVRETEILEKVVVGMAV
jgi:hypothetical protein